MKHYVGVTELGNRSRFSSFDNNGNMEGCIEIYSNLKPYLFTFTDDVMTIYFVGYVAYFYKQCAELALLRFPWAIEECIVLAEWFIYKEGNLKHGSVKVE